MITNKPKYVRPEYSGNRDTDIRVQHIEYNATELTDSEDVVIHTPDKDKKQWVLIKGLNDGLPDQVQDFRIGNIALTSILNVQERPHLLTCDTGIGVAATYFNLELKPKRLSIWTDFDTVITFQETWDPLFTPLIQRINHPESLTRQEGSERLFMAIYDFLVDLYYEVLDEIDLRVSTLETKIFDSKNPISYIKECLRLKTTINSVYSAVYPLHVILESLLENCEFTSDTRDYAKDIGVHISYIVDKVNLAKANTASLIDLCMALNSNQMNEVMKLLTVLSTYFLPLSFLCAVWGMNFKIPETSLDYGYLYAWIIFIVIIVALTVWFRRKRWL